MLFPQKICVLEISRPLHDIENLSTYRGLLGIVRHHGTPIGCIQAPVVDGRCEAGALTEQILRELRWPLIRLLIQRGIESGRDFSDLSFDRLWALPPPKPRCALPHITVAICTRDRPEYLRDCLNAVSQIDYPRFNVVVVDNAPRTQASRDLVEREFPEVTYVCEPRPGLDWARNRAIIEATGDVLAYTDDDVLVDPGWLQAIAHVFADNPDVAAMTGLVVPAEIETEAQALFEAYGGFGRGFYRSWNRAWTPERLRWDWLGTGRFGTGANMAFRRRVFEDIGGFDPALDVGTVTNGGGDLEMFFRVLKHGHTLAYEPSALVRHRHRRDLPALYSQITYNGIGLFSYFASVSRHYPEERPGIRRIAKWCLRWWLLPKIVAGATRPTALPARLAWAELRGMMKAPGTYRRACANAEAVARAHPQEPTAPARKQPKKTSRTVPPVGESISAYELGSSMLPLAPLFERSDCVRLCVTAGHSALGSVSVYSMGAPVSAARLADYIADALTCRLIERVSGLTGELAWAAALASLADLLGLGRQEPQVTQGRGLASIVIATRDRPEDLRRCLRSLLNHRARTPFEIVVVDNAPRSGKTAPVIAEFPSVTFVPEARPGLSFARNAGIAAARGTYIVMTDDDVTVPPGWLDALVAPLARADVAAVTGNVLPATLETQAQRCFELYGGLGKGFTRREFGPEWFDGHRWRAVPTWEIGATANAAFRASVFRDPRIGLLEESLGAGMPAGVGEDTYLFYRILKAGYRIVYEPAAYVWHRHRVDFAGLRRQLAAYSRGHVAYHLTTLTRDGDWRGLVRVLYELPRSLASRTWASLRRRSTFPLSLLAVEIAGTCCGVSAYVRSRRRASRLGRNPAFLAPAEGRALPTSAPAQTRSA